MEELADLLEVIWAVAAARGSSIEEVEAIRRDKAAKRGRYSSACGRDFQRGFLLKNSKLA